MDTATDTNKIIQDPKPHKVSDQISPQAIQECLAHLAKRLGDRFIVVGGAAMVLLGSTRSTNCVSLLVPYDGIAKLTAALSPLRNNKLGTFIYKCDEAIPQIPTTSTNKCGIQIKLLLETSSGTTYETAKPRSVLVTIGNNNDDDGVDIKRSESIEARVLQTTEFIANKIHSIYSRPDTEVAYKKIELDALDIAYLCKLIFKKDDGWGCGILDVEIMKNYRIGHYHFYLLQVALDKVEAKINEARRCTAWELFLHIGGGKFLQD